jgi:hypothetical protein
MISEHTVDSQRATAAISISPPDCLERIKTTSLACGRPKLIQGEIEAVMDFG